MTANVLERFYAQSGTLQARQFSIADAEPLFVLIDSNREHLSQSGDTTAAKYPTLDSVLESINNPKDPNRLRFGIWREEILLGSINLTSSPGVLRMASIGYWVGGQHTGQGVATEALKGMMLYATMEKRFRVFFADTHKDNFASQLVLHRAGFKIHYQLGNAFHWALKY